MARQTPGPAAAPDSNSAPVPKSRAAAPVAAAIGDESDELLAVWLGERLRRVALGATAALLTARAFWPSEPDLAADAGGGLGWVLTLMLAAGLALAGAVAGGRQWFRWSWADAGVITLVALVGASAGHAVDRRLAINLAWEWGGVGVAYLLVRNLPRTRGESVALLGALGATAVALSVYGLYQVGVELPDYQRKYLTSPQFREMAWLAAGVVPGTAAQVQLENRLLHSNEPYSTFALANSLAGFLVGPLVVMLAVLWDNLTRRGGKGSRMGAVLLALPPLAVVLVCLTLTKSRSAWVGLAAGGLALAWRERTRVKGRTLLIAAAGAALVVGALVVAGLATGRLDRQVASESGKSLRYRREYWVGTWRAINESPQAFWRGFGPGNLHAPYLRHKLPQASEEIHDPHNLVLEVWGTAGVWAVVALGLAVAFGLGNAFARPTGAASEPAEAWSELIPVARSKGRPDPSAPPSSAGWVVASAAGGWLVVVLLGRINLFFGGGFERWLILGGAWALAVALGVSLARRRPIDGAAAGAAALAVLVNLTAAGGIGIPTVALALWTTVALGLNLRGDRACGRARGPFGRLPAYVLAAVWVALLGTFVGAVTPYWKAEAAIADAEEALRHRPPDFEGAEAAYGRAKDDDVFSARPWLAMAVLEYENWKARGSRFEDQRWRKIPIEMLKAVTRPRPPDSWSRHRERARMTNLLLQQLGGKLSPIETTRYRGDVVNASRRAVAIYPTNPALRAALAEASAEIGMIPDALDEGREALRLDRLLAPHPDKRLEPTVRVWLESKIPAWAETAEKARQAQPPRPDGMPKPGSRPGPKRKA